MSYLVFTEYLDVHCWVCGCVLGIWMFIVGYMGVYWVSGCSLLGMWVCTGYLDVHCWVCGCVLGIWMFTAGYVGVYWVPGCSLLGMWVCTGYLDVHCWVYGCVLGIWMVTAGYVGVYWVSGCSLLGMWVCTGYLDVHCWVYGCVLGIWMVTAGYVDVYWVSGCSMQGECVLHIWMFTAGYVGVYWVSGCSLLCMWVCTGYLDVHCWVYGCVLGIWWSMESNSQIYITFPWQTQKHNTKEKQIGIQTRKNKCNQTGAVLRETDHQSLRMLKREGSQTVSQPKLRKSKIEAPPGVETWTKVRGSKRQDRWRKEQSCITGDKIRGVGQI